MIDNLTTSPKFTRHLLWVGLSVLALNLLAFLLCEIFILASFRDLEEERIREHVGRAVNSLEREGEFLRRMVVDEAFWDQFYVYAAHPDGALPPSDFSTESFEANRLSVVVVTNAEGKTLFSRGYDLDARHEIPIDQALLKSIHKVQALMAAGDAASAQVGLLFDGPHPWLMAAAPILKTDVSGPARGMLLFARELTSGRMETLEEMVSLELNLDKNQIGHAGDSGVTIFRRDTVISGHVNLPDILGRDGGALDVSIKRSLYGRGRQSVRYFLGWTLASTLLFASVIFVLLNRSSRLAETRGARDRLLRNLLERSGEAILLVRVSDRQILEANPVARKMFCIKEQEAIADTVFHSPDGLSCWEHMVDQFRAGLTNLSVNLCDVSGRMLRCEVSASEIAEEDYHYLLLQIRDISAQKAAEEALRAAAERYRTLFDGSPVAMWVYDAETLQFVDVNQAAIDQYGYTREEFLHLSILDLRPDTDADAVREGVAQITEGQNHSGCHRRAVGVWRHLRKDGTPLSASITVVPFLLGGRNAILASALDVTESLENEQALRASEERYRQMFENSPLPMWVVDMQSLRYLDVNQTAVEKYGYSREEFLSMTIIDIRPPEDVERLQASLPSVKNGDKNVDRWRHRCKDGRILDVEIVLKDIPYAGCSARLVMADDVTERESLRREAERNARLAALGELTAGVAHEINNPNGMILRNLGFIADVVADALPLLAEAGEDGLQLGGIDFAQVQAEVPQLMDDMLRGAGHIRDIVRDMKDFARFDETSEGESFDLNEAVAAAIRLLEGPIRKATDAFAMELGEQLPQASGRIRQVEQVIINLLMNACQALPGRSCGIRVRTSFDPGKQILKVEVIDQGKGASAEDLERLTDPFFTTRRETGGTGLGLSVSARIVKQHGGTLGFQSRPGEGMHATMTLPVS